jgi:hypothetical protein
VDNPKTEFGKLNTKREEQMENTNVNENTNPLSELISDDVYTILLSKGLIDEKSVRDYVIKKKFMNLRANRINASDAIEVIRSEYPYLQFDTIRKIVYQPRN